MKKLIMCMVIVGFVLLRVVGLFVFSLVDKGGGCVGGVG